VSVELSAFEIHSRHWSVATGAVKAQPARTVCQVPARRSTLGLGVGTSALKCMPLCLGALPLTARTSSPAPGRSFEEGDLCPEHVKLIA
jgi:hypothetical protein